MNRRDIEAQPSGFGVAQVHVENAVDVELGLDKIPFSMDTLNGLAKRGGTAPFPKTKVTFPAKPPRTGTITVDLLPMIQKLEALGLVEAVIPTVKTADNGFADVVLRLTEKGGNVVDAFAKKKIVVGEVKNISVEQAIEDGKSAAVAQAEHERETMERQKSSRILHPGD